MSRPPRLRDRFALSLVVMTMAAVVSDCGRAWPGWSAGGGFALVLGVQIVALSALWTAPLALLFAAANAAVRAVRRRRGPDGAEGAEAGDAQSSRSAAERMGFLVWLAPAAFLQVTVGTELLEWSAGAFVRQDLAAAVMSIVLLSVFALVAAGAFLVHRLVRDRLGRLPLWAIAAITGGGMLMALIGHLARFPALLDAPSIPAAIQLALVAAAGAAVFFALRRLPDRAPAWAAAATIAGVAVLWTALFVAMLFGGRIAPLSYPVVSAAVQSRGLMASRVAPLLSRLGDGDGDGVGGWFGGLDCDDDDPKVSPLAKDVPGNGVDEDCFEGDLSPEAVAADRSQRDRDRQPPRQRARNLILVTVDAFRADAVGYGGARKPTTPNLDRLAARSTVFLQAWTQAPMTRRAFPALLAGRYPSNIHWLDLQTKYPYPVSHEDNLYLAEVLRAGGVETAMTVAFSYARNSRFDQGFQTEEVRAASRYKDEVNGNVIADDAIRFLDGWTPGAAPGPRFFLWLHFYEAHFPYIAHKKYPLGDDEHGRYLSEVRWIDEQVGRVLAHLETRGLGDDTAVVVTGDHGEEFGEHGGKAHGDLFPEDLRVPLLVHIPGARPGRVSSTVRVIDIAPTVADALGIAAPASFDGDTLLPLVDGKAASDRPVFAELIPDRAVPRRLVTLVSGGWQLIVDFALGTRQLFDLVHDPTAQDNVLVRQPGRARQLEVELRRHMALRVGPLRVSLKGKARDPQSH